MKNLIIYIHGKGGSYKEAEHYKPLFKGCDVIGFDYHAKMPWEAKEEFHRLYDKFSKGYDCVILIANSIGAFFAMHALCERKISLSLFVSPIVDMERLISDMMTIANVTENELESKKEIPTNFGETLSWGYFCYVRSHPISWKVPTCILYGEMDNLTSRQTVEEFSSRIGARLSVMPDGEHWFHTEKQMLFLDEWVRYSTHELLSSDDDADDETDETDEYDETAQTVSSMTLTGIL